jgi:hypothetical protein
VLVRIDPIANPEAFKRAMEERDPAATAGQLASMAAIGNCPVDLLAAHLSAAQLRVDAPDDMAFVLDCLEVLPTAVRRCFGPPVFVHPLRKASAAVERALLEAASARTPTHVASRCVGMLRDVGFANGIALWTAPRSASPPPRSAAPSRSPSAVPHQPPAETHPEAADSSAPRYEVADALEIVEEIRRRHGRGVSLDGAAETVVRNQQALIGRALRKLSDELYSKEIHFVLELIQNADDNAYPDDVVPSLEFVIDAEGIVVRNNERGFTERNIRSLCDIGNSTKAKQSGYIGQKGIGFKVRTRPGSASSPPPPAISSLFLFLRWR